MTTRRSFLARLSAFLGGAVTTVPKLVEAAERKTECSTATDVDVVYVVTKAILDAQPGDRVVVRDGRLTLHRWLRHFEFKSIVQAGALEWVRDLTPKCAVRAVTDRSILRLVP